ncbi:hypothetical protein M378DRAFT_97157 [Amanita muscaria Koide BX008]|uniref:Cytochrome b561 domain-containing protein n=1 Tax=Amanita muscaria (strain Koide BX008) TaxID=946122 RepID=A0A0C2X5H4_AMAMK|nr:hypothetical protein M378DRAFT_97157 [Amanita muscaria Koide BX008]
MFIQRFFILSWIFSSVWLTYSLESDPACSQQVCVNATYVAGSLTYEIQVKDSVGWMGLGFGQGMVNTHMVVMWHNEDKTTTLSQRYSKAYSEPQPTAAPLWSAALVQASKSAPSTTDATAFTFQISVNETDFNDRILHHSIIWAYSRQRPSSSDPSSRLQYHNARGVLNLNFGSSPKNSDSSPHNSDSPSNTGSPASSDPSPTSVPLTRHERVIFLHGVLVSFGFFVVLPTGGLVARYTRTFTSKWFKVHQLCNMFVGLPIITMGTILGPTAVFLNGGVHLRDPHQVYGLFILVMVYVQVWLGRYIHLQRRKSDKPSPRPIPNYIHVAVGLVIIGSAIFQIKGGLYEWEAKTGRSIPKTYLALWKAASLIVLLLYVGGLVLLPRQFRQEKEAAKLGEQYIALSEGPNASRMNEVIPNAEEDGLVENSH